MAIRNLLHANKLEDFENYLGKLDYMIIPTIGEYEVLRAKKKGDTVVIYQRNSATEHVSVMDKDYKLVRNFLKGVK